MACFTNLKDATGQGMKLLRQVEKKSKGRKGPVGSDEIGDAKAKPQHDRVVEQLKDMSSSLGNAFDYGFAQVASGFWCQQRAVRLQETVDP
eukprot:5716046-Alexandrium_andersonii.AAC.1